MPVSIFIFDGLAIAVAGCLWVRPPGFLVRRWVHQFTTQRLATMVWMCAAVTALGIFVAAVLPADIGAARYQLLFPILLTDVIAAAQYRAVRRQLT